MSTKKHRKKKVHQRKSAKNTVKKSSKKKCAHILFPCIKGGAVLSKERERERASERGVCVCVKYK